MAKLKDSVLSKFTPYFSTAINGRPISLSVGEMEKHPEKYVNTHLVEFYEDTEAIKKRLKESKVRKATKLDMGNPNSTRGYSFNKEHKSPVELEIEKFKELSKLKRGNLTKKHSTKLLADKKAKEAEDKQAKADKKAKDKEEAEISKATKDAADKAEKK